MRPVGGAGLLLLLITSAQKNAPSLVSRSQRQQRR